MTLLPDRGVGVCGRGMQQCGERQRGLVVGLAVVGAVLAALPAGVWSVSERAVTWLGQAGVQRLRHGVPRCAESALGGAGSVEQLLHALSCLGR